MSKKIILSLVTVLAVVAGVAGMAAYEAHVINVTAKIENALTVITDAIPFGTVFPQEHLNEPFRVALSGSFLDEITADDVVYRIRQKPKCGVTTDNGTVLVGPTGTGHVTVDPDSGIVSIDCGPEPRTLVSGETWGVLPSLCKYLSKEPDTDEDMQNDSKTASFHYPYEVVGSAGSYALQWNDTDGRLAKSDPVGGTTPGDVVDDWNIDLDVPCFEGHCAQDWTNEGWELDPADEHKIFGCNLWIEVVSISRVGDK